MIGVDLFQYVSISDLFLIVFGFVILFLFCHSFTYDLRSLDDSYVPSTVMTLPYQSDVLNMFLVLMLRVWEKWYHLILVLFVKVFFLSLFPGY